MISYNFKLETLKYSYTLNQEPAIKRIETNALRWFGHINTMDESRKPKQIWEARVEGSSQE